MHTDSKAPQPPQGLGLRQPSAAFHGAQSARGLAHSKTLARLITLPFFIRVHLCPSAVKIKK